MPGWCLANSLNKFTPLSLSLSLSVQPALLSYVPSAFLHERDDGRAQVVVVVFVGVLDGDAELGVGGERVEGVAAPASRLARDPGPLKLGHFPLRPIAAIS